MTLGDIIQMAVQKDIASQGRDNKLYYTELVKGDKIEIKFGSDKFPEASIECSAPYYGLPEDENTLRLYFLSMVFNAAIHGMKRMNHKKGKRKSINPN